MDDETKAALRRVFGYVPAEDDGEKWVVWRDHHLIVAHPERRPRIYKDGCAGNYYEIEPMP